MLKISCCRGSAHWGARRLTKTLLVMKLTIFFLTIGFLNVSAKGLSQNISFSGEKVRLESVFSSVEKQTAFVFVYDNSVLELSKPVSISARDISIKKFLEELFKNQPLLKYRIDGRTVLVSPAESPSSLQPAGAVLSSSSQNVSPPIDVKGRIVNEKGEPLPGITVRVKGTTSMTTTDNDGVFTLQSVNENAIIVFTGVAVEPQEVRVRGRNTIGTITLKAKVKELDDVSVVVNTGYQTISKERVTGSFGTVSKEQIEKPTPNIGQRIIGSIAGVQARSLDASGNPTFEIRGQSSLRGNAAPLIIVDNFPIHGDLSTVNPNDVESITVLKDAAAASVWGSRSANGVIVVTTKRVRRGAPLRVDFNAFTTFSGKMNLNYVRPLASSAETVDYEKLTYNNWKVLPDPNTYQDVTSIYSQASILYNEAKLGFINQAQLDAGLAALKSQDNKQQIKDYLLSHPATTQYNLSMSGGSEKSSNMMSLLYESNKSNFKGTDYKRYMLTFRNNTSLAKWLDFGLNGMYMYKKDKNNGMTLADIQSWSPYDMLVNPDGSLADVNKFYTPLLKRAIPTTSFPYADWTYNPIQEIANRQRTVEQTQARLQAQLTFKIMRGMNLDLIGQYELRNAASRNLSNENTFEVRSTVDMATTWNNTVTPNTFTLNLPKGSILNQSRIRESAYNLRAQMTFNRTFAGKHEVSLYGNTEIQDNTVQTYTDPTAYGYNDQTLGVGAFPNGPGGSFFPIRNFLGTTQTFGYVNSFAYTARKLYSGLFNAGYTYNGKYSLTGSYKVDGSNLIADDPSIRYNPFYSFGAAWQMSKENFMHRVQWVDRLTARVTYGISGNYDASTAVKPLVTPSASSNVYINDFTASVTSFGNPTLRWERTRQLNLAFDYSLFRGKLYGKVEVYRKQGADLVASLSIPAVYGTTTQLLNNAAMTNKGIELELGTSMKITKDLTWRGNANLSYNYNEITSLFVANYNAYQMAAASFTAAGQNSQAWAVGYNANTVWRYRYAGVDATGVPTVYGLGGAKVGYYQGVAAGNAIQFMRNMGTSVAPYTAGFLSSFQYKGFDLSFIMTGKFGHVFQRLGFNYANLFGAKVLPNSKLSEVVNGDPSKIAPLPPLTPASSYYLWQTIRTNVDYLIENASVIRMQEINLTYTIPARYTGRIGFNRVRVYAQGNDLFTILWNKAGEDPEYPMGTIKPMPRYTFGIRFEF